MRPSTKNLRRNCLRFAFTYQMKSNEHGLSDDCLMARAAQGDSSAFNRIVERHQARLQRFAIRMLGGDNAGGADVAVGALIRLWERRAEYRPSGQLEAWLLRVAYRLCIQALRARKSTCEPEEELAIESAAREVERPALAEAVRNAVMQLPETRRAVLILSVYEGLSYDEISKALLVPEGTVASRKNHALTSLRRQLHAWDDK